MRFLKCLITSLTGMKPVSVTVNAIGKTKHVQIVG